MVQIELSLQQDKRLGKVFLTRGTKSHAFTVCITCIILLLRNFLLMVVVVVEEDYLLILFKLLFCENKRLFTSGSQN